MTTVKSDGINFAFKRTFDRPTSGSEVFYREKLLIFKTKSIRLNRHVRVHTSIYLVRRDFDDKTEKKKPKNGQ